MSGKTKIEWADRVWNPTVGCAPVSEGCRNCYAKRMFERFYQSHKFEDVTCHPERLNIPEKWIKPQRIFVDSMSDLFHEDVPFEYINRVFAVMAATTRHTFMVLTKRPERMFNYFDWVRHHKHNNPTGLNDDWQSSDTWRNIGLILDNVWLGVSVEDQKTADERIPLLLQTPAAKRFVSVEPMLGAVDMRRGIYSTSPTLIQGTSLDGIDWVICGGESGPGARPMHPYWAGNLRDQCVDAGVPFFFKQWGEWKPISEMSEEESDALYQPPLEKYPVATRLCKVPSRPIGIDGGEHWNSIGRDPSFLTFKVGKKKAGQLLDGRVWNEFPGGE